jgi:hypothetical protein
MRRGLLFTSLAILTGAMLGGGTAVAIPPTPPAGFEYVPSTQRVMIGIGCVQSQTTTCDSTSYWLGEDPGDSTVGTIPGTVTPYTWAAAAAGEEIAYETFVQDDSLSATHVLRSDGEPIRGQVTLSGFIGGGEVGVDSTVKAVLSATRVGPGSSFVDLGTATVNKQVVTPTSSARVYSYELPVAANLDGVKIKDLTLTLYVRSINVLQNGYVNGEGGSWFDLPYYELVPTQ